MFTVRCTCGGECAEVRNQQHKSLSWVCQECGYTIEAKLIKQAVYAHLYGAAIKDIFTAPNGKPYVWHTVLPGEPFPGEGPRK